MMARRGVEPDSETIEPKGFDDFDMRLGDLMRGERATAGKSLLDVERDLRIKAVYLVAIENCDLAAFDAPSFIAGYVRSYARYLQLDPEESFAKFCQETGFRVAHGMSPAASTAPVAALRARQDAEMGLSDTSFRRGFAPQPESGNPLFQPGVLGTLVVLAGVIGLIGYGGYSVLQAVQRVDLAPIDQAPVVMAQTDGALAVPEVGPSASLTVSAGLDPATRVVQPQALDVPVLIARDGPIAAIDPQTSGLLSAPAVVVAAVEEPVQVVTDTKPSVEILAARASWISVSTADGTVLFEKVLNAGERYTVPALEMAARLRAGNASGLYFVVNGKTYGPASAGPEVIKNVDLSALAVQDSYVVADLAADQDLAQIVAENAAPKTPQ